MHLLLLIPLLLGLSGVLGNQVPVVDGILGGVPKNWKAPLDKAVFAVSASNETTPGKLRVVENSGVCETTPGVYQASGYGDIASRESIWFWFFASRDNPDNDPLTLWFNGGPGSSSMIGLLQENGPCRITNDSTSVTLNPFSWNNHANVLYIDQPVGVGFSHGALKVSTSQDAAADVWTFLQIFLNDTRFSKYQKNDLAIWTESYGGHYGPTFATHFLAQNAAIANGTVHGVNLNLKVLGIGNGLTDPLTQYAEYSKYAADNPYHPLVSQAVIDNANKIWTQPNGCRDQIITCNNGGNNTVCSTAQQFCNQFILTPLAGDFDVYYVPEKNPDPYPPDITNYINSVASKIGAETQWTMSSFDIYDNFATSGDWMRTSIPDLEKVINAGVRTLIFDGDADFIVNFKGVEAMVDALSTKVSEAYKQQTFEPYKVAGQTAGQFKNSGTFSYLRVSGAGHEVPAYKFGTLETGQVAAQMFTQVMAGQSLSSTDESGKSVVGKQSGALITRPFVSSTTLLFIIALFFTSY